MVGSNEGNQVLASRNHGADCSEPTVEIKIKTLDSQTYTLRVEKCVPVPELKEQIASVTGVISEHQRLICRGRVLKDDQLLSAYHVEDGHTLHLVVRQPIPPLSDSLPDNAASDHNMDHGNDDGSRPGPRIFVGTFNISREPDGTVPAVNQILATLLSSIANRNGSGGTNSREPSIEQLPRLPDLIGSRDSSRPQPIQATLNPPQPPVQADSLTTMSQFLSHLRDEFGAVADGGNSQNTGSTNIQGSDAALRSAARHSRSPRPGTFAEVLRSTRQLLVEQAADCIDHLAQQLEDQENVTNTVTRSSIQMNGLRSGNLLHSLGALLLELGRVTTRIEMGQTPDGAVVNAGPPLYVSGSGPNPITVRPFSYQINLGANPTRTSEGTRNADASTLSVIADERESNSSEPSAAASSDSSPTSRLGAFRIVPVRTVVASISASFGRPSSESSQTSAANVTRGQHPNSDSRNSDSNFPSPTTNFPAQDAAASTQETTPRVSDEGDFLSNVLRRILPFMPRSTTTGSGVASERDTGERETSSTQGPESGRGSSSRRRRRRADPPPPSSSDKRQKRR